LALQLWQKKPGDFGGLVLDAAYPLDEQKYASGKIEPLGPPKDDAIKSCPILALVGGADGGSAIWQRVAKSWHAAKIPLIVHIIPDKGHEWLFNDATEQAALHDWLKRVSAGETPDDPASPKRPLPGEGTVPAIKVIYTP
ncbi:MAG TPA: hypothetical protein VFE47_12260, partial [Tepidisphaeraceae bacterium]|nr:hypothetical protein [Tepidisphaeraceae bacterium]